MPPRYILYIFKTGEDKNTAQRLLSSSSFMDVNFSLAMLKKVFNPSSWLQLLAFLLPVLLYMFFCSLLPGTHFLLGWVLILNHMSCTLIIVGEIMSPDRHAERTFHTSVICSSVHGSAVPTALPLPLPLAIATAKISASCQCTVVSVLGRQWQNWQVGSKGETASLRRKESETCLVCSLLESSFC